MHLRTVIQPSLGACRIAKCTEIVQERRKCAEIDKGSGMDSTISAPTSVLQCLCREAERGDRLHDGIHIE